MGQKTMFKLTSNNFGPKSPWDNATKSTSLKKMEHYPQSFTKQGFLFLFLRVWGEARWMGEEQMFGKPRQLLQD